MLHHILQQKNIPKCGQHNITILKFRSHGHNRANYHEAIK